MIFEQQKIKDLPVFGSNIKKKKKKCENYSGPDRRTQTAALRRLLWQYIGCHSRRVAALDETSTLVYCGTCMGAVLCLSICLSVCPSVTMCATSKNGEMGLFRPDLDSIFRLKSNF